VKRAWLDSQHQAVRARKQHGTKPQAKPQASEAAQRVALREFAIYEERAADDAGRKPVGLVDIGANLHGRYSLDAITRQLERAACAGVETVILTGCDIAGSKKGADVCEALLSMRQNCVSTSGLNMCAIADATQTDPMKLKAAARTDGCTVELWTTSGCHPHDAHKIASRSDASNVESASPVVVSEAAVQELREMAGGRFCVAIGECGLDYDRMFSPRDVQLAVFDVQVRDTVDRCFSKHATCVQSCSVDVLSVGHILYDACINQCR
jgi:Tat protein secretion system quality control protein TatD with DNase activity